MSSIRMDRLVGFLLPLILFVGPLHINGQMIPVGPDEVFVQSTLDDEIKIMSYNLLNLFDAEKDPASDDWLWLPENTPGRHEYCLKRPSESQKNRCLQFQWNDEKVDQKINQINKVVQFQGSLPDLLAVLEIENENVLSRLAKKLGYKHFLITHSADRRGIDVGLMFNLKEDLHFVGEESLHVPLPSRRPARDILRVDFTWRNKPFSVYVNHWPSQRNPTAERIAAAQVLARNIDLMFQRHGTQWSALALGDFNTIPKDSPHPFSSILHRTDWKNALIDGETLARQSNGNGSNIVNGNGNYNNSLKSITTSTTTSIIDSTTNATSNANPSWPYTPPGSFYYLAEKNWNSLDRVFLTQNLVDESEIEFLPESFRLPFPAFMSQVIQQRTRRKGDEPAATKEVRIPRAYNFETTIEEELGFSDHLPLIFKLRWKNQSSDEPTNDI